MSKNNNPSKGNGLFKRLGTNVLKLLKNIYYIIDKIIVTPISKFMLLIIRPFKSNNRQFDRLLNNKAFLLTFSLALAFFVFFTVDNMSSALINNAAEVMYGQKVDALYNEEAYVVEGLPESVDITMIGRKSDLYLAKQYPADNVTVDLRDLKPGTHKVSLKYTGSVSSVTYKLDPTEATIVIYEKVSSSKKLENEVLNQDKLDQKYTIDNVTFSRDEVYVKGAQYKIDQVASIKALVNIEDLVNPTIGENVIKDIPLIAYDAKGEKLDVEIVPSTIDATVTISSPSKEVSLVAVPNGDVVFGKAIKSITLSETKATIYGDEASLAKVTSIPINVDVSNLERDTNYQVNITLPSGITEISVHTVTVKVSLSSNEEKTFDNINIETKNIGEGLIAQAASQSDTTVSVIVKGTSDNITTLKKEDITASVDLTGLGVGTHTVNVDVTGKDVKLTYTPKTTTVTIVISQK